MRARTLQPLVDELAAAILSGRLKAGDRLPPQRTLARQRGQAASTVSLAYQALARRGLVVGETGRGTFVRGATRRPEPALAEPSGASVDLALNVPILPEQARLLAERLASLLHNSAAFEQALRPVPVDGPLAARAAAARFLSQPGWRLDPAHIVFANTAKQGIAAILAALLPGGGRLACDALTYPVLKAIAAVRPEVELVPIAMDDAGTSATALLAAHARRRLDGVYLQPVLHNPTGVSMPEGRQRDLARLLRRLDLWAIEDAVYAFLAPGVRRFAHLAPERVVVVESFSKRIAPGLSVGVIAAPADFRAAIVAAVRTAAAGPGAFALEACTRWMTDGTAAQLARAKCRDAANRQHILRRALAGLRVQSDPRAYHAWIALPAGWRADAFEAAAAAEGIAVVRAAAFAVREADAPQAVRVALASPTLDTLRSALEALATLARSRPSR